MLGGMLAAMCMLVAAPSAVMAMDIAVVNQVNTAKVAPIEQSTDLTLNVFEIKSTMITGVEIFEYGGELAKQVDSNKLSYRESNVLVANFAVKQNQNFERMAS